MSTLGERTLCKALESEGVLRALLFRYVRDPAVVDEVLQETYGRICATSEGEPIRSVRAYAMSIARNVALDWLRQQPVVPIDLIADLEALDIMSESAQVEEVVNHHDELTLLARAAEALPGECRRVFTLRKVYGLTQQEIAERLQISNERVEKQLTKAARRCAASIFPGAGLEETGVIAFIRRTLKLG